MTDEALMGPLAFRGNTDDPSHTEQIQKLILIFTDLTGLYIYSRTPLYRGIQYNAIVLWTRFFFFQLKNTKSQENHKNKSQSMYKNYEIPDLDVPLACQKQGFHTLASVHCYCCLQWHTVNPFNLLCKQSSHFNYSTYLISTLMAWVLCDKWRVCNKRLFLRTLSTIHIKHCISTIHIKHYIKLEYYT